VEQVSEVEIAIAKVEIGSDGVGCEPASAVTLAGLKKLVRQGFVKKNERIILVLTGHVLKDPEFTLKFHRGDLFTGSVHEKEVTAMVDQQRAPLVLDANTESVMRVLDEFDGEKTI
jgi:threonine synthase